MVLTKEKQACLIVSKDKELKNKSVSFFIAAGYPGEKKFVEAFDDIERELHLNQSVRNIILDAQTCFEEGSAVDDILSSVGLLCNNDKLKVLMYMSAAQKESLSDTEHRIRHLLIETLPPNLRQFNNIFNKSKVAFNKPIGTTFSKVQLDREAEKLRLLMEQIKNTTVLTAAESSKHLIGVFESVNQLKNDHKDFKALEHIGQRFNGIFGTFVFYGERPGWSELCKISYQIDNISKTYLKSEELDEVATEHVLLLIDLVKGAFRLLHSLRESAGVKKSELDEVLETVTQVENDPRIIQMVQISQDEVDNLIEKGEL